MSDLSILLTNATINTVEYAKEQGKEKIGLAIFSKNKNAKEFEVNKYNVCYEGEKGNELGETDVLYIKGERDTIEINSFELKGSKRLHKKGREQMIRQSLLLISVGLYGLRINLDKSCIYVGTSRGNVKIRIMYLNGYHEGDLKNLPLNQMLDKLYDESYIFSDIDIYFNRNANAFNINYRVAFPHSIYVDEFSISINMRRIFLKTIIEYYTKIAKEIIQSNGAKKLSYLLTMYYDSDLEGLIRFI